MLLAVTAIDVGFVGALAGVLGVVVTPVVSIWLGRKGRQHDRSIRAWEDKRTAYVAILQDVYHRREYLRGFRRALATEDLEGEPPTAPERGHEEWVDLLARTMPFASKDVLLLVERSEGVWSRLADSVAEADGVSEMRRVVNAAWDEYRPLTDEIQQAIHRELA